MSITKQEAFDKALNGVTAQGFPSLNSDGQCAYREHVDGGATRCCGVGWLIDDETAERWDKDMIVFAGTFTDENVMPFMINKAKGALGKSSIGSLGGEFLDDLQQAHDKPAIEYYEVEHLEGIEPSQEEFIVQFTMNMWLVAQLHGLEFEA